MSAQEDDMDSLERSTVALNYTPNFQNIFSSDNRSASNGTSSTSNKERINLPTPPVPNHCNQIVQPQSPIQQLRLSFQQNPLPQPPQLQPQIQTQQQPQSQSSFQQMPQSQNTAIPQLRYQQPSSSQQQFQPPPLLPQQQQQQQQQQQNQDHNPQQDFTGNQLQRMLASDAHNFNQSQITNRSSSVPNLEQQQQQQHQQQIQQPTRNASTSYIAPTSPLIQPANSHQQNTFYHCPNEQFQRNSHNQQNIVNHSSHQHRYSPNQQPSSDNVRSQFQTYSRSQSNQQPQTRATSNLNPSSHNLMPGNNYYNNPRPIVQQQVMQNHMQPQVPPGYGVVPGRIMIQPQSLQNQCQPSQFPNQYPQGPCPNQYPHVRLLRLASPPPLHPVPPQHTINQTTHSGTPTHNSPEVSNAPHLARALAPIRSSNIDAMPNLVSGCNQPPTSSDCFIRPPASNFSHNQVSNSNSTDNNPRMRLAQHISRRGRNTPQQNNHCQTNTTMTNEFGLNSSNAAARVDPQVIGVFPSSSSSIQTTMPSASITKTQSIATQTERESANKAMQFDGKLKLLENKALNATVQMDDKSCQTDELLDKSETTKIYVDRASSPILSAGLTILQANNLSKHVPVRMKKTTKRRDLNCNGEETNLKVRKLESGSDTDVDIETLE